MKFLLQMWRTRSDGPASHAAWGRAPFTFDAMDKRIRFETKEQSNARREREFLALSPSERVLWFLRSFNGRASSAKVEDRTRNFVIRKEGDALR